ncbi:hypothetical protein AMK59_3264 [Oryctes borbonicus]|uniref:VOC domain-containing protein n=1 Tax=Oryctes borbonicus TaxID=1629725 RepID=A0A0T6B9D2_9SCAR|nr:hypothetical protein AMK59_3264 [Oryctes borbonicus]
MSGTISGRALHYVFKIGDRGATARFYREILGMKVLRHEEFADGCDAACNGPYANRWSKTMIGYGPEDNHFVMELTYNYPIKSYERGNEFIGITIKSKETLERARKNNWPILPGNVLEAPGGYQFFIIDEPQPTEKDPVEKVTLASSNLQKSIDYWNGLLGLKIFTKNDEKRNVLLGFNDDQAKLELQEIDQSINRAKAYGRIAFSCPYDQQPAIDAKIKEANATILTPLISLDTPGKATVRVIILADPDGHEICFVDDEAFKQLSKYEPDDEKILDRFIKKDESGQLQKQYGDK